MGILRQLYANTRENFRQSVAALRASPMRSVLTMAIVAIGITALMGMLTVIGAITHSLQSDLGARQGAAFRITSWASNMSVQGGRYTSGEDFRYISCREGASFAELYAPHGTVGLDVSVASIEARRGSYHTRPYLNVRGVNRDFFTVEQLDLEQGRCFRGGAGQKHRRDAVPQRRVPTWKTRAARVVALHGDRRAEGYGQPVWAE